MIDLLNEGKIMLKQMLFMAVLTITLCIPALAKGEVYNTIRHNTWYQVPGAIVINPGYDVYYGRPRGFGNYYCVPRRNFVPVIPYRPYIRPSIGVYIR